MTTANPAKEFLPMPMEAVGDEWKKVNYPGVAKGYTVSIYGQARSPLGKTLKPNVQNGQLWVSIKTTTGRQGSARLDRLVLSAFAGHEPDMTPEHIDGDNENCQLINLKWREPTKDEATALKALKSRRANATKAKRAAAQMGKKKVARASKTKPAPRGVQVERLYKLDGVQVTVGVAGGLQSIEPNPNRGYTPAQTMALAEIMLQVAEMNTLMGVNSIAK